MTTRLTTHMTTGASGHQMTTSDHAIELLLQDYELGAEWTVPSQDTNSVGITRRHWVSSSLRSVCSGCEVRFSLTERCHHCRRCGDVFCKTCVSYQRRLNAVAHPDPQGALYKVCQACFQQGPQTVGFSKDWTTTFKYFKSAKGNQTTNTVRSTFDRTTEYKRLRCGFEKAVARASSLGRVLEEVKSAMTVPEWQKGPNRVLENLRPACSVCGLEFRALTRAKVLCAVCGAAVCSSCASSDLIVYVPDGSPSNTPAQIAAIEIVGCPEKEPAKCVYLKVCSSCLKWQQERQALEHQQELDKERGTETNFMDELDQINTDLRRMEGKICAALPQYQLEVETLDVGVPGAKKATGTKNSTNIQTLAKTQGDLSDHFSHLVMTISKLKTLKPQTKSQTKLMQNIIKAKCTFYQEQIFTFRELRRGLAEVTPPAVLERIQAIVDRDAINSAYVSVKQLALETVHLCDKHGLPDTMPMVLMKVESALCSELRACVAQSPGLVWEEHERVLNELLQEQLRHHRLIRPSRRLTKQAGREHVADITSSRCRHLLRQVQLQLSTKAADSSFPAAKAALTEARGALCGVGGDGVAEEEEWVTV